MLDLKLTFQLASFFFFISLVQSKCSRGCDLALGSYYIQSGSNLTAISKYLNTNINNILKYNPTTIPNQDILPSNVRINVPFTCECIQNQFLAHVFSYEVQSQDTYDVIAEKWYANLTNAEWIHSFNTFDPNRIPDEAILNVTVNCSCGDSSVSKDYGLFLTYPIRSGESLDSVSASANLSAELIRRYNPDADFSDESALVYLPWKG